MLCAVSTANTCISYPWSYTFRQRSSFSSRDRVSVSSSLPDNNNAVTVEYTPWLIVGLGNPGNKYHGTRHNVGFEMIDKLAQVEGVSLDTIQSKALMGIGCIGEVPILLAKPQAYMNFSGEAFSFVGWTTGCILSSTSASYFVGLAPKGGHGHHNGVRSVMDHLEGSRDFPRLCIGIGNPPGTMDMKAFLLQKFSPTERQQIDDALEQGVEAVRMLMLNGFNRNVNRFNLGQKYKYHKVQL